MSNGMEINSIVVFSIFASLEGLHAYSAFLPSVMTIGTFVDSPEKVRMIREGEVFATLWLAGLVTSMGIMVKSWYPIVFGLLIGGVTLMVYEYALKSAPAMKEKEEEFSYFGA